MATWHHCVLERCDVVYTVPSVNVLQSLHSNNITYCFTVQKGRCSSEIDLCLPAALRRLIKISQRPPTLNK